MNEDTHNLNIMTIALKSTINYKVLVLGESFYETYFGHAFSKACQYATMDEKNQQRSKICTYQG